VKKKKGVLYKKLQKHLQNQCKNKSPYISNHTKTIKMIEERNHQEEKSNSTMKLDWNPDLLYIGIDEVGRGPLFGRVYAAATLLPKDMDTSKIKDSKLIHSAKKRTTIASMIKANAVAWSIQYETEQAIDTINILQATQNAMHKCVTHMLKQIDVADHARIHLLIDGTYFRPYVYYDNEKKTFKELPYTCIVKGDGSQPSIGAASIIAKVERDAYVDEMCDVHPYLDAYYGLRSNKGYGSKKHMDGIRAHGISAWHRTSFAPCKGMTLITAGDTSNI
jgi:ribonuclease HII